MGAGMSKPPGGRLAPTPETNGKWMRFARVSIDARGRERGGILLFVDPAKRVYCRADQARGAPQLRPGLDVKNGIKNHGRNRGATREIGWRQTGAYESASHVIRVVSRNNLEGQWQHMEQRDHKSSSLRLGHSSFPAKILTSSNIHVTHQIIPTGEKYSGLPQEIHWTIALRAS